MIFVDTNYFLRFFLNDVSSQQFQVKELFMEASEGKVKLFTSTIVFFEMYWVLKSFYKKTKPELVEILRGLFELKFIKFQDRLILDKCLGLFDKSKLSLEDCYNIFYAKSKVAKRFKTFDIKLEKEFLKKSYRI